MTSKSPPSQTEGRAPAEEGRRDRAILAAGQLMETKRDTIQKVLARNKEFALNYDAAALSPQPQLRLVVIACMDTRITLAALGLKPQDAHFIRNAGGIVTDDVLRSLLVSHYFLGTNEVMVINHTDCGLMKASEEDMHKRIEREAGVAPSSPVRFYAFSDVEKNVREQLEKLNAHSWVREELMIRGFVFDVRSGKLKEVVPAQ
jgi:carbonic anhydrase